MAKKGKKKTIYVKPTTNHDILQINIKASLDNEKKINPNEIFEGIKKSEKGKKKTKTKK
jgi:hypothetical protein|tara:strand:+ start:69 stop:245 length:177 start_codon:yes stop_codon:yes gene_type:complete